MTMTTTTTTSAFGTAVTVLAHGGHWITSALYVLPIIVLGATFAWQGIKDRRRPPAENDSES